MNLCYYKLLKNIERGDYMTRHNTNFIAVPDKHTVSEFLKGQASKIFDEVIKEDKVVIVNKHSKPQNVIISYERYKRLKSEGADI